MLNVPTEKTLHGDLVTLRALSVRVQHLDGSYWYFFQKTLVRRRNGLHISRSWTGKVKYRDGKRAALPRVAQHSATPERSSR